MLGALPGCGGSTGSADEDQVRELKDKNAALHQELDDVKQENQDLQEELDSASAAAVANQAMEGGSSQSASASSSTSASAESGAPVPDKSCEIGKACDLGKSSVTVTSAKEVGTINTSLGNYQGDFVLVEFDYTFGGSGPVTLNENPWLLEDDSGTVYTPNFDASSDYGIDNDRTLIYEEVQPGVPSPGSVVFEISPDSTGYTLYIGDLAYPQAGQVAIVDV
jgi:ribosomal protein L9